jgi:hypothetical protein
MYHLDEAGGRVHAPAAVAASLIGPQRLKKPAVVVDANGRLVSAMELVVAG